MYRCAYRYDDHPETGWPIIRLSCQDTRISSHQTIAQIFPNNGCNLFDWEVDGIEYLTDFGTVKGSAHQLLGIPILYPTPNRVRGAQFTFEERTFTFPPNNGANFIHGLVRDLPWKTDEPAIEDESISLHASIKIAPDSPAFELFPISNTLSLILTLKPGHIRFDFTVQNDDERQRLPFGLAIHPYFRVIGPRDSVRIEVPARKWMEAANLLPTGKLVDLSRAPADLTKPQSLSELALDDVFWGLSSSATQTIYYDNIGTKVTLAASDFFTHSVVYTPPEQPYFCLENQSCATDAHNLYAQGLEEAAHLTILEPGESHSSWIEFSVADQE
ncbi:MAG: aldose 1-epimerase [Chloroflexi bacterium]|nr:aldose 1-epimerase [Chloroflexota bacterium]